MPTPRAPQQAAKRAIVLGTISLRASCELSPDHPDVPPLVPKLYGWLEKLGLADAVDPIEFELLQTPLGQLSDSFLLDANWAGEAAAFFGWMLYLLPPLDDDHPADQSGLARLLHILQPEAASIIQNATLRNRAEIEATCLRYIATLSLLRESRTRDEKSRSIVRQYTIHQLSEVGQALSEEAIEQAQAIIDQTSDEMRPRLPGIYNVRSLAAFWFLSDRPRYFEPSEDED